MVDGLRSFLLPIFVGKPPIRTTFWAACAVGVFVVRELRVFAVDEAHAVVWACFDLYHAAFTDFLEEFLGQGPGTRVVVGGQEQEQQLVHAFCGCIGDLYKSRNVDNM